MKWYMPVHSTFAWPIYVPFLADPLVSLLLHRRAVDIKNDNGVLWCIPWYQPLNKTFLQGDKNVSFWIWRHYIWINSSHTVCRFRVGSRKRNELLWKHLHPVCLEFFTAIKIAAFDDFNRIPRLLHMFFCNAASTAPRAYSFPIGSDSTSTLWSSMTSLTTLQQEVNLVWRSSSFPARSSFPAQRSWRLFCLCLVRFCNFCDRKGCINFGYLIGLKITIYKLFASKT